MPKISLNPASSARLTVLRGEVFTVADAGGAAETFVVTETDVLRTRVPFLFCPVADTGAGVTADFCAGVGTGVGTAAVG